MNLESNTQKDFFLCVFFLFLAADPHYLVPKGTWLPLFKDVFWGSPGSCRPLPARGVCARGIRKAEWEAPFLRKTTISSRVKISKGNANLSCSWSWFVRGMWEGSLNLDTWCLESGRWIIRYGSVTNHRASTWQSIVDFNACGFALVAEKLGIASAGAGTTVRVCMGLSLMTIQSDNPVMVNSGFFPPVG